METRVSRRSRLSVWATSLVAIAVALLTWPVVSRADTATQRYGACMEEAAAAAGNCYGGASGYVQNKVCDWKWDIDQLACAVALLEELTP